jgi:hypothetical protein
MPTPTRRLLRRSRRYIDYLWLAGIAVWTIYIAVSQHPWRGANEFQAFEWLVVGAGGIAVGAIQKRGKDYWPANAMLGLAAGTVPVFYFTVVNWAFNNNVALFRLWVANNHVAIFAWGLCSALLGWALFLVVRVNRALDGSSVDIWGRVRPPTAEQAIEALAVLRRAMKHGTGNLWMHPEFVALRDELIASEDAAGFGDPARQLSFERERARVRIARAEARFPAGRPADEVE